MIHDTEIEYRSDKLTEAIIQGIITVHKALGPGFLENVYRRALCLELKSRGFDVETEKDVTVYYHGVEIGHHRLDIMVDGKVIVELKTVDQFCKAHYAQVLSYLRATGLSVGILVNFSSAMADFRRIENEELARKIE